MTLGNLLILCLIFLDEATTEDLCLFRRSIDVIEGEYFFLCSPGSEQDTFQNESYMGSWYKKNEENVMLIQETSRIVPNGSILEFWPAELGDSGIYSYKSSNGKHSVTEWTLNVLKRNNNSCFNQNHLHVETRNAGSGYSLKCSTVTRNTGGNVTWYKNCTFHTLTTEGELNFNTLSLNDSGIYTCKILITHEGKVFYTTSTTNLKIEKGTPEFVIPKITEPTEAYIETKTGKDEVLNCTVFRGYSVALNVMFYWLINGKHAEQCSDSTNCTCQGDYEYFNLGNEWYASKRLWIKKVTEEDMNHNYTCILIVPGKMQKQTVRLKKGNISDLPPHLFTTGVIVAILSSCVAVLLVVLGGIFRVDLVLLYRDVTGKDETVGDGKEYDAFVSYLKDCITTNDEEGKFALEILPKTLEEHFGYKLCIFERDVTPGGAIVDDVLSFIDKSRRLIVILSKNYVSDKVMYELESGLHKALVERKIKIILINYMPISDYNFLPKSLALLPSWRVVQWKKDQSLPLNSRFWKNLRYLMPAKTFKSNSGCPNNCLELDLEQETQSLTACWKTKTFI